DEHFNANPCRKLWLWILDYIYMNNTKNSTYNISPSQSNYIIYFTYKSQKQPVKLLLLQPATAAALAAAAAPAALAVAAAAAPADLAAPAAQAAAAAAPDFDDPAIDQSGVATTDFLLSLSVHFELFDR